MDEKCKNSFKRIKIQIQSDEVLTHYNINLSTVISSDSSPYAVRAVISHVFPDDTKNDLHNLYYGHFQLHYKNVPK